jgi:hypothetical protein
MLPGRLPTARVRWTSVFAAARRTSASTQARPKFTLDPRESERDNRDAVIGTSQGESVMPLPFIPLLIVLWAASPPAQSGPCTEKAVNQGQLAAADDVFSYMPPFGRPIVGKAQVRAEGAKAFGERTNITRSWAGDHRIVTSPSGDMAYEYGTLRMGYDEAGKHTDFEAVLLTVYQARSGVCRIVASTMQPLEESPKQ